MEEAAEVLDESGAAEETAAAAPDIDEELLVEEISIDGMCGVY
jgi:mycofactocin precursor